MKWLTIVLFMVLSFGTSELTASADEMKSNEQATTETPLVQEQQETIEEVEPEEEVPVEITADDFKDAKALTIEAGARVYSSHELTTEIATWNSELVISEFAIVGNALEVEIGTVKYYVAPQSVQEANIVEVKRDKTIGAVRTKKLYTIYSDAKNDAVLMRATTQTPVRLEVTGMEGNYFTLNVAGTKGYIAKKDITVDVSKSLKVLKNTSILSGSRKVAILTKNGVIKASNVKGNTYTFNGKYTFTSDSVVETDANVAWPKKAKASYPVTLTAQKAAGLYNAKGEKFAEIPAKTKISLVNKTDKFGIINMLGGTVYVKLTDFKHVNLIAGEKILTHHEMNYKLQIFALMYPEFMKLEEIGKSVEGRSILALTVGTGKKQVLFDAAMHAREHMTTNVLMEMIDNYSYHYIHNSKFAGYNVRTVLDRVSIAFVPMINPDGVTLVQGGKVSTSRATLIKLNGGSTNFARWKANIRGVDLNRNWDVRWHRLPTIAPKWEMAKGPKPFSEPETIALRDFVLEHPFKAYITYHSSGQIMFWEYGNGNGGKARATALVRDLSKTTGYAIMKNSQTSPTAASEPWVGKIKDAPAVTMEIAPYAGNGPVPLSRWSSVWKKNQSIGLLVANQARGY